MTDNVISDQAEAHDWKYKNKGYPNVTKEQLQVMNLMRKYDGMSLWTEQRIEEIEKLKGNITTLQSEADYNEDVMEGHRSEIEKTTGLLKEASDYLDQGHGTSIGCGSILHRQFKEVSLRGYSSGLCGGSANSEYGCGETFNIEEMQYINDPDCGQFVCKACYEKAVSDLAPSIDLQERAKDRLVEYSEFCEVWTNWESAFPFSFPQDPENRIEQLKQGSHDASFAPIINSVLNAWGIYQQISYLDVGLRTAREAMNSAVDSLAKAVDKANSDLAPQGEV